MLAVTAVNMVHSEVPIFDDAFEYFEWYLANDSSNVGLQCLNRSSCRYPCRLWTLRNPKGKSLKV